MITASLVVRHPGCLSETLTGDAQAAQISSDKAGDVLVMHAATSERVDRFLEHIVMTQAREPLVLSRTDTSIVLRVINPAAGVISRLIESSCAIVWPVVYADGVERFRVLAPSRSALEQAVRRVKEVGDVDIAFVNDAPNEALDIPTTIGSLVTDLTARQLSVLSAAIAAGYYASPKRTTLADLSKALGVSQTTLSEHLRKAEGRLMERFAELLAFAPVLAKGANRVAGRPKRKPGR